MQAWHMLLPYSPRSTPAAVPKQMRGLQRTCSAQALKCAASLSVSFSYYFSSSKKMILKEFSAGFNRQ